MKAYALFALLILLVLLAILVAAGWSADRAAQVEIARGQAEAIVIRAQGQAALDRAQATQMTAAATSLAMLAAVPWGVLGCLGVLGIGVLALSFAAVINRPTLVQAPPQIIERQIILLPGGSQATPGLWIQPTEHHYRIIRKEK